MTLEELRKRVLEIHAGVRGAQSLRLLLGFETDVPFLCTELLKVLEELEGLRDLANAHGGNYGR